MDGKGRPGFFLTTDMNNFHDHEKKRKEKHLQSEARSLSVAFFF